MSEIKSDGIPHKRSQICIVGCGDHEHLRLQSAIEAVNEKLTIDIICGSSEQLKDVIQEQVYYLNNKHQPSDFLRVFADDVFKKENHPYGWYRKFEKKRF